MVVSVLVGAGGLLAAWLLYRKGPEAGPAKLAAAFAPVHKMLFNKYWVDELYDLVVVRPLRFVAKWTHLIGDRVFIDTLGVHGSAFGVKLLGAIPRIYQNGDLHRYLAAIILAAALIIYLV